ncbi:MAG: hypothetical protein R2832_19700 [Rhodothermales bacterium]
MNAAALNDSALVLSAKYATDSLWTNRILDLLDQAIATDSTYRIAYWSKASLAFGYGRYEDALEAVDAWLFRHPHDDDFALIRAELTNNSAERQEVARRILARADSLVRVRPESVSIRVEWVYWLYAAGDSVTALREMAALEAQHPDSTAVKLMAQVIREPGGPGPFLGGNTH